MEKNEQVKVLFAVESGSRAWGFPSKDSDYDVRFIYIHRPEWYFSIDEKRDVLEYPIHELLDISGWDIRKALNLFRKSNPALMEWLRSPILYLEQYSFLEKLRELSQLYFSPKSSIYHYLHMASGNYRDYLQGEQIKIKKYFYVLRPILACQWIEKYETIPPMEFEKLVESLVTDPELNKEINKLLARKKSGEELSIEPRIGVISEFIEVQLNYYKEYAKKLEQDKETDISALNQLFQEMLQEVWE
ncbi:nucleotidyltransferase domain-containing protein [Tepidibacillus marianensis]|uniref:nucleotidyltransferase domain-containing protein n=1 Tax=Tepidibacillus marianensis TaxID=3131995 RepID=UPI0030D5107D